jgi:hypothetical protein
MTKKGDRKRPIIKHRYEKALIKRGFFLYACYVKHKEKTWIYLDRIVDNYSSSAASPSSRLGRRPDLRPMDAATMLRRHLMKHHPNLRGRSLFLAGVGPLYLPQQTLKDHRRIRDQVALIEAKLTQDLRNDGYKVIGKHPFPKGDVVLDRRYKKILQMVLSGLNV